MSIYKDKGIAHELESYAQKYECEDFLKEDPSWFMHQVVGNDNKEVFAFIAASLSYGSRKQFFPKIQYILDCSKGAVYQWIKEGKFHRDIPLTDVCYYRLYTCRDMNIFLTVLQKLLDEFGSLKSFVKTTESNKAIDVIEAFVKYFYENGSVGIIPRSVNSSCKRLCMFLRWMVRDNSPVDLGIWSDVIDRKTLIMPLDTHVLQQAIRLELIKSKTASMSQAIKLTEVMKVYFPNDPLKGDFALFGYGVNT